MPRKKKSGAGEQPQSGPQATTAMPPDRAASAQARDSESRRPDPQRIAARAYELYLARGGEPGRAMDDWLAAEGELGGGKRD
jgi:hypothetical protein